MREIVLGDSFSGSFSGTGSCSGSLLAHVPWPVPRWILKWFPGTVLFSMNLCLLPLCPANSSPLDLSGLPALCLQSGENWALPGFPLLAARPGNDLLGHDRTHFVYFLSLRDHLRSLPDAECPDTCFGIHVHWFLSCFRCESEPSVCYSILDRNKVSASWFLMQSNLLRFCFLMCAFWLRNIFPSKWFHLSHLFHQEFISMYEMK